MARITGKSGAVKLGGTKVASLTNWSIDAKLDTVDDTAFEDIWHNFLSTFKGWTGTVEGIWEQGGTNTAFWDQLLLTTTAVLDFYPDIGTTEKFTGSAFCDFSIKVAKDGVITFTAAVKGTGAMTRTP